MSVSAITDQALALQQQLTLARALVEAAHGAVPEAVAVELVLAWALFWVCGALLTGDALMSLAANGRWEDRGPIGLRVSAWRPGGRRR